MVSVHLPPASSLHSPGLAPLACSHQETVCLDLQLPERFLIRLTPMQSCIIGPFCKHTTCLGFNNTFSPRVEIWPATIVSWAS